ncbi:MAG: homocysteine S-methyltransferase family protein, partial [Alphaproteobacteria bacterium]
MPKNVVLLDGGMGQELLKRSAQAPHPMWSAKVLMDEPDIVEAVHMDYINAGANVITLNAYSATPERLARDSGQPEKADELFEILQQRAIELAHSARSKSKAAHDVRIAGSIPPLNGSYKPEHAPKPEVMLETYRRVVALQRDAVDVLMCETMSGIGEAVAATTAALESGLPVWLAFSLSDKLDAGEPRLRSGEPLSDALAAVFKLDIDALMLNCSVPEAISAALPTLLSANGLAGAYANGFTGISALELGGTVDGLQAREDLGPEAYAQVAMEWVSQGVRI